MQLSLFNSLTNKIESFEPISSKLITMYVCGPTVYNDIHIGNARAFIVYDILYRILKFIYGTNTVKYVRNITDIDDKIINMSIERNISIEELTKHTTRSFHKNMEYLGCLKPTIEPKATDHIYEMISMIETLIRKGYAYISDSHVYFSVNKYKDYTKLSKRTLNENIDCVRIANQKGKKNINDFVLWKPAMITDPKSVQFESPFGLGRPGWHIECSAMSCKHLGTTFDIHGGGGDLIFPHHTNEIAQSVCAFPNSDFARFWIHNGFLTVNHEKMSKSLNNFITVNDLIEKNVDGDVLRLFLISTRYHKPIDYNDKAIADIHKLLTYWYKSINAINETQIIYNTEKLPQEFIDHLLNNMNTHMAINTINEYAKAIHTNTDKIVKISYAKKLLACAKFLGVMRRDKEEWLTDNSRDNIIIFSNDENIDKKKDLLLKSDISISKVNQLLKDRNKARKSKNWKLADDIRNELHSMGITIVDNK